MSHARRTGILLAAAALAATSACSSKADGAGATTAADSGQVKVGRGVMGDTLKLGVLTDLTGPFASIGADVTNAQTLYWEQRNAGAKICGTYTVQLNVQDTGYVPQKGVQLYSGMKNDVLAMQQTIGSSINTALAETYKAEGVVSGATAFARSLTALPGNVVPGSTYDVEMTNALGYALQAGLIKEGAKVGHIYIEGEYGANGLAGSKYMATKHGLQIIESQVKPGSTVPGGAEGGS